MNTFNAFKNIFLIAYIALMKKQHTQYIHTKVVVFARLDDQAILKVVFFNVPNT